nr:hypothetical protein [Pseudonocardia sp. ICBG601]
MSYWGWDVLASEVLGEGLSHGVAVGDQTGDRPVGLGQVCALVSPAPQAASLLVCGDRVLDRDPLGGVTLPSPVSDIGGDDRDRVAGTSTRGRSNDLTPMTLPESAITGVDQRSGVREVIEEVIDALSVERGLVVLASRPVRPGP